MDRDMNNVNLYVLSVRPLNRMVQQWIVPALNCHVTRLAAADL